MSLLAKWGSEHDYATALPSRQHYLNPDDEFKSRRQRRDDKKQAEKKSVASSSLHAQQLLEGNAKAAEELKKQLERHRAYEASVQKEKEAHLSLVKIREEKAAAAAAAGRKTQVHYNVDTSNKIQKSKAVQLFHSARSGITGLTDKAGLTKGWQEAAHGNMCTEEGVAFESKLVKAVARNDASNAPYIPFIEHVKEKEKQQVQQHLHGKCDGTIDKITEAVLKNVNIKKEYDTHSTAGRSHVAVDKADAQFNNCIKKGSTAEACADALR